MLWDLTLAMTHPGFRMTLTWLQTGRALSRASTRGSLRIMKLRKMNYSLIIGHLPIILSWSLQQQINEEGLRLLIGQWCYRLKSRAAVGTPGVMDSPSGLDFSLEGFQNRPGLSLKVRQWRLWVHFHVSFIQAEEGCTSRGRGDARVDGFHIVHIHFNGLSSLSCIFMYISTIKTSIFTQFANFYCLNCKHKPKFSQPLLN